MDRLDKVPAGIRRLLFVGCSAAASICLAVAMWVTEPSAQIFWFTSSAIFAVLSISSLEELLQLQKAWRITVTVVTGVIVAALVAWACSYVVMKFDESNRAAIIQAAKDSKSSALSRTSKSNERPTSIRKETPRMAQLPEAKRPQLTAEDLAEAVAKKLADKKPNIPPPAEKPCRGEDLSSCTDEALIEWGKPLIEKISAVSERCSERKKSARQLDSKRLIAAFDAANVLGADEYRDCCAEDALKYRRELALRLGGGLQSKSFAEWTEKLLQPSGSKERREAERRTCTALFLDGQFKLSGMVLKLERNKLLREIRRLP